MSFREFPNSPVVTKHSPLLENLGFPCGSAGKESSCNEGDLGSIPGLGRSPGERKGYPLQYSGLENSMDCTWVTKSWTWLRAFHFTPGVWSTSQSIYHQNLVSISHSSLFYRYNTELSLLGEFPFNTVSGVGEWGTQWCSNMATVYF